MSCDHLTRPPDLDRTWTQVEPREAEIVKMKDRIKKMDSELEHYHKVGDYGVRDVRASGRSSMLGIIVEGIRVNWIIAQGIRSSR